MTLVLIVGGSVVVVLGALLFWLERRRDPAQLPARWLDALARRQSRSGTPAMEEPSWWTGGYGPRWMSPGEIRQKRITELRSKVREVRRA